MSTYKLEETPDTYISPCIDPYDSFVYRMVHFDGESNWRVIGNIDLRKDELIVHGTRINESLLQKLHSSLVLRPRTGKVYVNANGACYIVVTNKGIFRPINNIIFDWSLFGVIVPNSVNHSLRKQVQQKVQELAAMNTLLISSAKGDASALKKEMEEFKQLLLTYQKDQEDMKMESREVRCKISSKEFELEDTKIEFESFKEEVKNLREQLYSSKNESEDMKTKVQNMQDQLCSVEAELRSTKIELQSSKKSIKESESCNDKIKQLEEENLRCRKESEAKEAELLNVEDQLSLRINEFQQSINIFFEYIDDKDLDDNKSGRCYVIKAIDIIDE